MKFFLGIFLLFFSGCVLFSTEKMEQERVMTEGSQQLRVWMLSDIQPQTIGQRADFERAVEDMMNNFDKIDLGILAGDILPSGSRAEAYEWFLRTRVYAPVNHWYEVAGNHDVRSGRVFQKYFPLPPHYGVEVGNILLLLLSDQSQASQTEIADESFQWWESMVRKHQDKIIVTVTHAQLRHSGLLGSLLPSRRIYRSDRFENVLSKYRTALWVSGHTHLPHGLTGTVSEKSQFQNVSFVNVSSIGSSLLKDSQSRFFIFQDGSTSLLMRSRNHSKKKFEKKLDHEITLQKPFRYNGQPPRLIIP